MTHIQSVTTPGGWLVTGNSEEIRRLRERRRRDTVELTEAASPVSEERPEKVSSAPVSRLKRWIIHPLLRHMPVITPAD